MRISFIGMQTQEVPISPNVKVVLKSDSEVLDEVMVVAYGTAKKSTFTGSASVVKADKLEKRQVSNITNALSGNVAGVQTTSSNGQPGTSATVRIRGIGSMASSNEPLYVVDGIPFDGDISSINSQDIETMTVLKDAAAAALYGARGANGVILVTTKKGKTGEARISVDARWGSNSRQVGKYDVIESPDVYMETLYKAQYNAAYYKLGRTPEASHAYANAQLFPAIGYQIYTLPQGEGLIGMDGKINPNAKLGYSDGQYYYTPDDWTKGTISSQLRQEYNLSVSGGTDRLNYYFSAGYLEDNGVIESSGFNRISTRMTVDYQAKKWLKFGTNMGYTNSKSKYPGEQTATNSSGNAFYLANEIAPVIPMFVRNADGSLARDRNSGKPIYDYGDGSSTNATRNWMSMSNPKGDLLYNKEEYLMDILNGKWFVELSPIEGLKLTGSLGVYIDNTRYNYLGNKYYGQSASYGGSVQQEHMRTSAFNQQYLATYRKSFGLNNFDALVGYESYDYRYEYSYATGQNLYKDYDFTVNNSIDNKRGGGARDEYSTRGIIGRINYDYNEKYFASASYRRDASSRFHPDKRWGNFWSASAAWVISKESFMDDVAWIEMLKLKASFGQQGNDALLRNGYANYYPYIDQFSMTGADGIFSDGTLYYKGNPDITWEKSNAFNVGTEFALFRNKLEGSVEYFSRKTSDMLYNKPVANSNGYSSIPMNIGSMTNSGVELDLTYNAINTNDLKWSIFGNATFLKNKINELHPDLEGELISGSRIYREGESMYQLYLVKYAGVDPTTGQALYWAKDDDGKAYTTSNYAVASNSKEASGDLLPTVYGGFGTSLDFYGFDFSIQLAYQLGGKIWDYTYQDLMHGGNSSNGGHNWHKDIAKAWTPEHPNTDVPRLCSTEEYDASSSSDRWIVSSNYLSINNITLGYTLPKRLLRNIGVETLRIYGAADNVALFAARKGLDPRQGYVSSTTATYGALRSISAGVKLTF
ncbi:SusC/RagA family TonB-linked outer membrane protein [Bacteroides sp. GD17]|uniref:SusC/RagA family TonB-linked outer membrane protein n=1 Tax=Bacteroides sp. GD17 TaxID=3139826 RepID=UPI0025E9ACA3|nr:SusC/RagA family TonB-linked outer membrane protein [uncultured Bacteroides sp.]